VSENWKSDAGAEEDVQRPLNMGTTDTDTGDSPYIDEPRAKMNHSTMALVAAFIAALSVLYLLGLHNKPKSASAEDLAHDSKVKSAISDMLEKNGKSVGADQIQNLFKDTDKLVQMFYHYLGSQASKSADLPGNPFAQEYGDTGPVAATEAVHYVNSNAAEAEALRRIAETFNKLKLQSVLIGKTSMAMIDNHLVQVGNKIGELTVTSIEPDRVLLNYGSNTFELKVNQHSGEKP
jgi:hypothetical protein